MSKILCLYHTTHDPAWIDATRREIEDFIVLASPSAEAVADDGSKGLVTMANDKLKTASENRTAAKLREVIGAGPDEDVEIVTPQFTREPGATEPASPPVDFDGLRGLGVNALREMGCRRWDEPDESGHVLMLFPGEWYEAIPAGFRVVNIFGETESFVPGTTDDDIRFGCLPYGLRADTGSKPTRKDES